MIRAHVLLLSCAAALVLSAGCGNNPTAPTKTTEVPFTTPQNVSFPGVVGPNGSVSRTFVSRMRGTARAALSGITPSTRLSVGLGIPRADGTGCMLAQSSTAANGSSADVSAEVDIGTFCTQVFAPAGTADNVNFVVTLQYP